MKFISWNVNGLRACVQKGFTDFFKEVDAYIFCIQETKLQEGQIDLETPGYHQYCNYAVKYLIGVKNFASFTDNKETNDTVRRIYNIKIVRSGEKVRITYYGSGFLYHMVRILTGTLIEIGTGRRDASKLPVVIAAEDRSLAGFLAPARGLFLRKVYY